MAWRLLDQKIKLADSSQATEVAMSWYLTVAERQAIDMAIPHVKPPPDFKAVANRPAGVGTPLEDLKKVLEKVPELTDQLKDEISPITTAELETNPEKRKLRIEELKKLAGLVRSSIDGDATFGSGPST